MLELKYNETVYRFTFSFGTNRFFEPASSNEPIIHVEQDRMSIPLIDFLNDRMIVFYTSDLSLIEGYNIMRAPQDPPSPLDERAFESIDWDSANVDIRCEFGEARAGKLSIHAFMENTLSASGARVVYYDHGTGEIADFVSVEERDERRLVSFYHCKKSPTDAPGARIDAIYGLAGQVVKSVVWAAKQRILDSIRRRFSQNIGGHRFLSGDLRSLDDLLAGVSPGVIDFEFVAVQPGITKGTATAEMLNTLAAANDYLVRAGFLPLRIMTS